MTKGNRVHGYHPVTGKLLVNSPLGRFLDRIRTKASRYSQPRRHTTDRALMRQSRRAGEITSRQERRKTKQWRREEKAARA